MASACVRAAKSLVHHAERMINVTGLMDVGNPELLVTTG